jgi:hypothetical protein
MCTYLQLITEECGTKVVLRTSTYGTEGGG